MRDRYEKTKKYLGEFFEGTFRKAGHRTGNFWGGVKLFGRYARGDWMTVHGKHTFLITVAAIFFFIDVAKSEPGASGFTFVGFMLLTGFYIHMWVTFEPRGCQGPRAAYDSPSKEISLAICHGCQSWGVYVKGDEKGQGNGVEDLVEKLRKLARSHQQQFASVSAELNTAADAIEEKGTLKDMDFFVTGMGLAPMETAAVMPGLPPQLAAILGGLTGPGVGPAVQESVLVDATEYGKYREWRKEQDKQNEPTPTPGDSE